MAQNNANLYIENPTVNGLKFSWEVHLTPINTWSFPQSLGDCSWYFNYNSAGLSNPVLTFISPELSTAVYSNSTGLTGGKVQITTDITIAPPDFGTILTTNTKYHLYTLEMDITDASVQSLVTWDQLNTGLYDGLGLAQIIESYFGNGDLPLPVELSSFISKLLNDKVQLNWVTKTEVNNYGFNVEKRVNEGEWNSIGFVEGHGNSNSPKEYSYTDKELFAGGSKFQYRLKQVDTDGSFEYSDVVEVEIMPTKFELSQNYPNPFNPSTTIRFSLPKETQLKINIYNMLGELVETLAEGTYEAGYHKVNFNASSLSSGAYIYRIESSEFVQVKKMILLR
jgi:hypothetical protein